MFDLHTHTTLSDGISTPEESIEKAIELGFSAIGITDHIDRDGKDISKWVNFNNLQDYFNKINSLKEIYKDKIKVLATVEIDYYTEFFDSVYSEVKKYNPDYILASIHSLSTELNAWNISKAENQTETIKLFIQKGIDAASTGKIDILGHFNSFRATLSSLDERPFYDLYDQLVLACKNTGTALEFNTTIVPDLMNDSYIWKRCKEEKVPIVVDSDAHKPEILGYKFDEAFEKLNAIGCNFYKLK